MKDKQFHITFDSNVIEYVLGVNALCRSDGMPIHDSETSCALRQINQLISDHVIIPYVSEGYFTLEALRKKERKKNLGKPAKITVSKANSKPHVYESTFTMGPSVEIVLPEPFERTYKALKNIGGKILPVCRIAFPMCKEVLDCRADFGAGHISFGDYNDKCAAISRFIETELGGGLEGAKTTLQENIEHCIEQNTIPIAYDNPWYRDLVRNRAANILFGGNDLSDKALGKIVAEISDCDMVASHIAYGNYCLCTLDRSIGQGNKGILHPDNLIELNKAYPITVLSPCYLCERLTKEMQD